MQEMGDISKYYCVYCDFDTSNKYNFKIHLSTRKHLLNRKSPKKSQKSQPVNNAITLYCKQCAFVTCDNNEYYSHITYGHLDVPENISSKVFSCRMCAYSTNNKKDYSKHLNTKKHLKKINANDSKINENVSITKNEDPQNEQIMIDKPLFIQLVNDNQEFKKMMIEQNNKIMEISHSTNIQNITTNNTINAKINKFNMNVFLNEKCKDAMNISEFIESIKITFPDLEFVGTHGFVSGITKILTDRLSQLDLCKRPIHCTDVKREVLHIKEEDQWMKDNKTNDKTINMIEKVAHKNLKLIGPWQKEHPNSQILDTHDYSLWWNIAKQSNNGSDNYQKNTNQILKNIAKTVYIDKENSIDSMIE